ncbi:EAL domain-containing protein [Virgibacillus oceani]
MANFTPKNSNFLKKLFTKDRTTYGFGNDPRHDTDDILLLNYYASLAMHHPNLVIVFSPSGDVLTQNRNSINEFIGHSLRNKLDFKELVSKEIYQILDSAFAKTLKGKSERHEITVKNKHGQTAYMNLTYIPVKQGNNKVEGVYLIIEDITEYENLIKTVKLHEKYLVHAQEIAEVGSWEYNIEGDELYCSEYFYDIFGLDKADDISMDQPFQLVHPDDYQDAYQKVALAVSKGTSYVSEFRIYHGKTNEIRYITVKADAVLKDKKAYKLVGVIRDFTTQKQLENKISSTNENFKHIFDNLNTGIWMRESIDGKVVHASKGLEQILQSPISKLYKEPDFWKEMILPEHRKEVFDAYKLLQKGESINIKYRINSGDGTTKWVAEQTVPSVNNEGAVVSLFGMVADITPEMEMQQKLKLYATHDTLTLLPNQRSLYEKVDTLCENDKNQFALFYIDLDRFNVINDSLGYQIGDKVLINVANRLISILPENGYAARLGSNDFIIIIENYKYKEAIFSFAEKMITTIRERLTVKEYELHITTSIGISFYPEDGANKLTLIESAHSALYHAKQQGRNNYQIYSFSRDISSYKKYMLEKDMRKAIENEEFEIYYQPQVNAGSGIIESAEALIRWNHEEWGLVSPGEFIPLAEENHLIHHISDWVIKEVCSQLGKWKEQGLALRPIAINISPIRFLKKGLVDIVREQLMLHQIPAKYLEFEITEGSLLKREENVLSTMAALKELGVSIAFDDFGTGYATLNYLREFQPDTIKIDQVFVQTNEDQEEMDKAIISAVLHLANSLNVKTVAEGVEEYEHYEFLKQKECGFIQGYLFSEPVPLETFEKMLETGYLKPNKRKYNIDPEDERRDYYRLEFPNSVLGEMGIKEVNKRKVDLGQAQILIEDISLGGLKIYSSLKLPINTNMKLRFIFKLLGETFELNGSLVWKNEGKGSTYYYGVKFDLSVIDEDRLAEVINRITVMLKNKIEIPDTDFINEDAYVYLNKNKL